MEKNNLTQEIILATVLAVLAITLLEPFGLFMTDMQTLSVSAVLFIGLGLFATLMFREEASDEREELHRMRSDRLAFLLGATAVVSAIAWSVSEHQNPKLLILTLLVMIVSKIGARIWYRHQN